jgi:hypothetical protein
LGIITLTAIEKPRFGISLAPRGKSERASQKANRKSQNAKVKTCPMDNEAGGAYIAFDVCAPSTDMTS